MAGVERRLDQVIRQNKEQVQINRELMFANRRQVEELESRSLPFVANGGSWQRFF
jgi:hypothetical protein